jgi:proteasome alpha subunit
MFINEENFSESSETAAEGIGIHNSESVPVKGDSQKPAVKQNAMEIPPPMRQMGYDRAIAVFSPEGRMYQVEYARKAVEKATTALGIVFSNGVVLAAGKVLQKLLVPESVEKISKIDEHLSIASCGILADARTLVDFSRVRAQVNKITYDEPIEIYALVKDIADRMQRFTQVGGIRPYGTGLLIAGVDGTSRLFETDPSGTIREWKAHAIGRGAKDARKLIIEEYKENLSRDKAIDLAMRALKAGEKKLTSRSVELAVVEQGKRMKHWTRAELKELVKKY